MDNNTYLVHYGKGKDADDHAYISKEKKNGRWVYTYADDAKPLATRSSNSKRHQTGGYAVNEREKPNHTNKYNERFSHNPRAEQKRQDQEQLRLSNPQEYRRQQQEARRQEVERRNNAEETAARKEQIRQDHKVKEAQKDFGDDRVLNTYDQSKDRVQMYKVKKFIENAKYVMSLPLRATLANAEKAYKKVKLWMSLPSVSKRR